KDEKTAKAAATPGASSPVIATRRSVGSAAAVRASRGTRATARHSREWADTTLLALLERRLRAAVHERKIEVGEDARRRPTHERDRRHAVDRGRDHARVALLRRAEVGRVEAVEGELRGRIPRDLDLEALALGAEAPRRIQVLLAHQPVDRRRHD